MDWRSRSTSAIGIARGRRHRDGLPDNQRDKTMGRFDSRSSRKMRRRRAQSAKKARIKNRAVVVHEARAAAAPPKKRSAKSTS
jgi:hypothetical protein